MPELHTTFTIPASAVPANVVFIEGAVTARANPVAAAKSAVAPSPGRPVT